MLRFTLCYSVAPVHFLLLGVFCTCSVFFGVALRGFASGDGHATTSSKRATLCYTPFFYCSWTLLPPSLSIFVLTQDEYTRVTSEMRWQLKGVMSGTGLGAKGMTICMRKVLKTSVMTTKGIALRVHAGNTKSRNFHAMFFRLQGNHATPD